jgi:hypothetical protein
MLRGEDWTGWTPSGLPVHPLLFLSEAGLLAWRHPSFGLLRLPIALWTCVALCLTYWLHARVFRDRIESLLATTLTACLPTHLAYSRFSWDSSFGLVSFPIVLYSLLELIDNSRSRWGWWGLALGSLMTLWAHLANAVMLAGCILLLAWQLRESVQAFSRRRPITTIGLGLGLGAGLVLAARAHPASAMRLATSAASCLERLPGHVSSVGDILLGARVYEYLAGVPRPPWTSWGYPVLIACALLGLRMLYRRGRALDQGLLAATGLVIVLLLLLARALRLDRLSYERYALYLAPMFALLVVRAVRVGTARHGHASVLWPAGVVVALSCTFLVQFWFRYFEPLRHLTYAAALHETFHTGAEEPKAAAARAIAERIQRSRRGVDATPEAAGAAAEPAPIAVFAENWWVQHPIEYLLFGEVRIRRGERPGGDEPQALVVGFSGSDYLGDVQMAAVERAQRVEELSFLGSHGQPVLRLLVIDGAADRRAFAEANQEFANPIARRLPQWRFVQTGHAGNPADYCAAPPIITCSRRNRPAKSSLIPRSNMP